MERAGSGSDEERDSPKRVELSLELESVRELYSGLAPSLATDGIFVEMDEPPAAHAEVSFRIALPDGVIILEGEGSVLWAKAEADEQGPPGVAVRFTRLSQSARETIDAVIDAHLAGGGDLFDLDGGIRGEEVYPTDALVGCPARLGAGRWRRIDRNQDQQGSESGAKAALFQSTEGADAIDLRFEEVLHGLAPKSAENDAEDPRIHELDRAIAMAVSAPATSDPDGAPGDSDVGVDSDGGASDAEEDEIPTILDHWKRELDTGVEDLARLAGSPAARPVPDAEPTALERLPFDAEEPEDLATRPVSQAELSSGRRAARPEEDRPWLWWLVGAVALAVLAAALILLWPGSSLPEAESGPATNATERDTAPEIGEGVLPVVASENSQPAPTEAVGSTADRTDFATSRIRSIEWRVLPGKTEILIEGDGSLDAGRVDHLQLDDPPRILIRVRGIETPYTPYRVEVGSPEVIAIRIGHHPEFRDPTLYVVLDTSSTAVTALDTTVEGSTVRVLAGSLSGD